MAWRRVLSAGLVAALAVTFVVAVVGLRSPVGDRGPGGPGVATPSGPAAEEAAVQLPGGQAGAAAEGRVAETRGQDGSLPGQSVDRTGAPVVRDAFAQVAEPTCDDGTDCFAWRASTASWAGAPRPALGGSTLVVTEHAALADHRDRAGDVEVVEAGGLHLLTAYDLDQGTVAWQARMTLRTDPDTSQAARPVVADDLVLVLTADREVVALGRDDGRERWRVVRDGATRILDATSRSNGLLVALATDARDGQPEVVLALDPADGTERWAQPAGRAIVGRSVVAVVDQTGRVRGLDPVTGASRWDVVFGRSPPLALAIGPFVLIGDRAGLTLFDAAEGAVAERWPGPTAPIVWRDGAQDVVLLVAGDDLHHLDEQGRRWSTTLPEACCLGAQVDEESVVVALDDGSLLGLARDDGRVVARREVRLPAGVDGTHSVAAGHRFVARGGGEAIRVHDPITGDLVARLPLETDPLVVRNRVVLSANGEVAVLVGEAASDLVPPGG